MQGPKLSELYPKYYKPLPTGTDPSEVDTYVINMMFPVEDPTGCILHARKKLLIPGVRSGGKSMLKDVREARDTLNRYIALMDPEPVDGWYVHSTSELPEDLPANAFVQVRLKCGGDEDIRRRASEWCWTKASETSAITHWRYAP